MGIPRGTLVLQDTKDADGNVTGHRAGVYLGEDEDGTGVWAPFGTIEKIEPGDFDSAPETFANAVNAGAQTTEPAVVGGNTQQA